MPVRKIPKNFRSVTGFFPSVKNGRSVAFESRLERDFFLLLEFDPAVVEYEEQPLVLEGKLAGKKLKYTPDCLVTYRHRSPLQTIVEVKYRKDLEENKDDLLPRFDLAKSYAEENGLAFKVMTDEDIRSNFLDNCKFIYGFNRQPTDFGLHAEKIVQAAQGVGGISLVDLLQHCAKDRAEQPVLVPIVWHLCFKGRLALSDVERPIDNSTILKVVDGRP